MKIYALIDPSSSKAFYVGSTSRPLKDRLSGHISEAITAYSPCKSDSIMYKRKLFITAIINAGLRPTILLLKETDLENVDLDEEYFYKFYLKKGHDLIQSPYRFRRSKHRSSADCQTVFVLNKDNTSRYTIKTLPTGERQKTYRRNGVLIKKIVEMEHIEGKIYTNNGITFVKHTSIKVVEKGKGNR